ncbi:MAG: protein-tyrosine-phosphatase [Candidatus Nanohaloarchaea archaeon]|jgi:protein-tyrosine-phosphatase
MRVLFICEGNRFRSMIAEAFAKREGIEADSAGTEATGPIFDEVKQLVQEYDLEDYVDYNPEQVNKDKVDSADRIVCMTEDQAEFVQKIYSAKHENVEVWNIEDADPEDNLEPVMEDLFQKVLNMK